MQRRVKSDSVKKPSAANNGAGLHYHKELTLVIAAVNNGYTITQGRDHYVFNTAPELIEFINDIIPPTGIEQIFLDKLSDEKNKDDEDDWDEDTEPPF